MKDAIAKKSMGDPRVVARAAIVSLADAIKALTEQGDAEGIAKAAADLSSFLGVQAQGLDSAHRDAIAREKELRESFNRDLKKTADSAKYQIEAKPPFVSIGCVRLNQKSNGEWSLSILDTLPLETLLTHDSNLLVERSAEHIRSIEDALKSANDFEKNFRNAYSIARGTGSDRVSANLLMVLCSHQRSLMSHLRSTDRLNLKSGLSRAQFGYLLCALKLSKMGPNLQLHGATQQESKPEQYIPVPHDSDPRNIGDSRRVTSISIID